MKTIGKYRTVFFYLATLLFFVEANATNQIDTTFRLSGKPDSLRKIDARFDSTSAELIEGEIISKTLRVKNNSGKELSFTIDVTYPAGWKAMNTRDRMFTVAAGDSIFVPVRLVPMGKLRGNTKYLISTNLMEKDSTPVAAAYFYCIRNKMSGWEINILPRDKIYFLNRSNESRFDVSVLNTGNEDQEILIDFENYKRGLVLTDTTDKIIKKTLHDVKLKPNADTLFKYKAKYVEGVRNQRIVDTQSHSVNRFDDGQSFTLFIKTNEPKHKGSKGLQKAKRVDFVRLSDQAKANPYGFSAFPVIAEANVSNIVGGQPMLGLYFRGNSQLENGASLNYYSQFFFTRYYYANDYFLGSSFYVGYFDKKYSVEVGDIGGGGGGIIGAGGRGIAVSYRFTPEQKVGAFYTQNPGIFDPIMRQGFGAYYSFTPKRFSVNVGYSRINQPVAKINTDYFSINGSTHIRERHTISFGSILSHNVYSPPFLPVFNKMGYMLNGGYTGVFLKNRNLNTNVNFNYTGRYFDYLNSGEAFMANNFSSYTLKKNWGLQLSNNYYKRTIDIQYIPGGANIYFSNEGINNQLSASKRIENYTLGTGVFYNINTITNMLGSFTYHSRGANVNFSSFDYETNRLFSTSLAGGYTREIHQRPVIRDYFFLQFFSMVRYKTLSGSVRYIYGNPGTLDYTLIDRVRYPQNIAFNLGYQYQFRDPHFILQNFVNYSYYTAFQRHNFGYTPELNIYTAKNWRIRIGAGYYYSRSNAANERIYNTTSPVALNDVKPIGSSSFNLSVGVRKEFGIPNPFSKKKYFTAEFIAFIDLNGNKKKDVDEFTLENVVIKLDRWEIMTNDKGRAKVENLAMGKYKLYSFSLVELEGFFPNIDEDLDIDKDRTGEKVVFIPFVKGIKIYGKVVLDREGVALNMEAPVELSGIKIAALNGKTVSTLTERDGSFSFYIPYGKYILNMDEKILGDRFNILQNDIELNLDQNTESLFVTFYIVEKRRKINKKRFDSEGRRIYDGSGSIDKGLHDGSTIVDSEGDINKNPNAGKNLVEEANAAAASVSPRPPYEAAKDVFLKNKTSTADTKGLIYTVQLGAFQKPLNPNVFKGLKNLMYERIDNEFVRVTAGKISSEAEAQNEKANLAKVGFPTAFVSVYNNGKNISLEDATKILNSNTRPSSKQSVGGKSVVKKPAAAPAKSNTKSSLPTTKGAVKKPATPAAKTGNTKGK